jgi:hypothetical protein
VVHKLVAPCPHLTRFAAWPGTLYVLALFQVHLIRRGLERHVHWCHHRRPSFDVDPLLFLSTLQSKFNPRARMHAGGYVFGALNIHFIHRSVLIM